MSQPEFNELYDNPVFSPNCITPGQFRDSVYKEDQEIRSIRNLMAAILTDAITTLVECKDPESPNYSLFLEDKEWLMDDSVTYVFSFQNICYQLGIDPDYLREKLISNNFTLVGKIMRTQVLP